MNADNIHYLIHSVMFLMVLAMKYVADAKHISNQAQITSNDTKILALETRIKELENK